MQVMEWNSPVPVQVIGKEFTCTGAGDGMEFTCAGAGDGMEFTCTGAGDGMEFTCTGPPRWPSG